jgi:large conductance mechanosensitive channel
MLEEFKKFVERGNLLELAVAFIMGLAFAAVVAAFTNIILSLIAAIFGANASFDQLTFSLNGTPIPYGAFLTAILNFLIVAWVLFLLVRTYNRIVPRKQEPPTQPCEYCRTDIPMGAVRCPNCTSLLVTASVSTTDGERSRPLQT